jgi:hypothetical protein
LVTTLTHQLSGTIELDRTAGAQFTFSFGHLHIQKG